MFSLSAVQCQMPLAISSMATTYPAQVRRARRVLICMARLVLPLLLAVLALAPAAHASGLPLFDVGTSVVDITPTTPQYLGGYDHMDTPTAVAHDPLQVRAFFAGHGA